MLSIYYLLLIKYGVKEAVFAKRYEPWMHAICIGFPLATAIWGASIGLYEEVELGIACW